MNQKSIFIQILPGLVFLLGAMPLIALDPALQVGVCIQKGPQIDPPVLDRNLAEFYQIWSNYRLNGYALIDLESRGAGANRLYSGIFQQGYEENHLKIGMLREMFQTEFANQAAAGRKLIDVDIMDTSNNEVRLSGSFVKGSGYQELQMDLSLTALLAADQQRKLVGLGLVDVEFYQINGVTWYCGLWEQGVYNRFLTSYDNLAEFHLDYHDLGSQGYRLEDVELMQQEAVTHVLALWRPGCEPDRLFIGADMHVDFQQDQYYWAWMTDLEFLEAEADPADLVDLPGRNYNACTMNYLGVPSADPSIFPSSVNPSGLQYTSNLANVAALGAQIPLFDDVYFGQITIALVMPLHNGGSTGPDSE